MSETKEVPEEGVPSGEPPPPSVLANGGLTLEDCIASALRNNPELLAAGEDAVAARAEKRSKGAARWPSINLTGNYFHHQDTQRLGVPTPPGQPQYFANDIAAADIVVRLPLYAGGRIVNEFRAAELLAQAEAHQLNRTRNETVFNVTSTYYNILAQEKVVESTAFSRDTLEQHLARVEELIAAEKAAQVDALRTGVRLADIEHQLLEAQNVQDIHYRLLANFMGLDDHATETLTVAGPLPPLDSTEPLAVDKVVAQAYDQRSDYSAAQAALEAQARRVDVARGAREPALTLEAAYGGRWGFGGSGASATDNTPSFTIDAAGNPSWMQTRPLSGGGSLTTTYGTQGLSSQRYTLPTGESPEDFEDLGRVGLTVNVPIFEGGRINADIRRERARLRAAQQRLRKLEHDIRLEAQTAVLNANSARKRVHVTRKSIAEAEESLRIEHLKYNLGKGAIVDVLDAQDALLTAQTNYYRALSDYRVARAEVQLAAGGEVP
ncbi:MAG: TolC family protein [Candidatus Hydrogenedentota bacterium]